MEKRDLEIETYQVEVVDGVKQIHYNGYVWAGETDTDGNRWRAQEMTWCYVRVTPSPGEDRSLYQRMLDEAEACTQYVCPLTEAEAAAYRGDAAHLPLAEVAEDTPCGPYWCLAGAETEPYAVPRAS